MDEDPKKNPYQPLSTELDSICVETLESRGRLSSKSQRPHTVQKTRRKIFYAILLLVFIVSGTAAIIIHFNREYKNDHVSNDNQEQLIDSNENDQDQRLPQLRRGSMRYESPDLGRMDIYIRERTKNGFRKRSDRIRFPVAHYNRRQFPLKGPLMSFTPWIPIYVDRLTRQTIIYSTNGGVYILPPLINFYGKMFSIAELITHGYASLVSSGSLPAGPINMMSYFQPIPLYGAGIPRINPMTGGFIGGIQTNYQSFTIPKRPRKHVDIDNSYETEEEEEEEEDEYRPPSPSPRSACQKKKNAIYDYIVVGSGPGGTTVATRLALNNFKVLLIEAGPDYDDVNTRTPGFWPLNQFNPKITVHFNPYLYSIDDGVTIEYPRGITLGGSAQINVMVAIQPHSAEWDYIEKVTGDYNWNHKVMKHKYQKLTENCQYCTGAHDNTRGWLNTTISFYQDPLPISTTNPVLDDLLKDVKADVSFNQNINKENDHDCYFYPPQSSTRETGIRGSTYKRIKNVQAMRKSNFHVWTNTFVTKLIIDAKTKEACGVEYVQGANLYKASTLASSTSNSDDFKKYAIYAKREIIVSGGQWMTPQLLQLSGIGNRNLLKKFGIDVIQDLPGVGMNQQEHSELTYVLKLKPGVNLAGTRSVGCIFNDTNVDPCFVDYLNNPETAFYSTNNNLFAMLRSTNPKIAKSPDTAKIFLPIRFTGFRKDWLKDTLKYPLGNYLTVIMNLVRIQNNLGSVRIQSKNAFDTPIIQLQHFRGENRDVQLNRDVQNIRYLRKLLFTGTHFAQYIEKEELPGDNVQTDEDLKKFIEDYVWGHHACCTSKMGNTKKDPYAVVNSKGQVKGIKNLRICDISIFPKIPGYYPFMSVIMAAEKITDDIIKHAKY